MLDTGLTTTASVRNSEFGTRVRFEYDVDNSGNANDCNGHGTQVASVIAGNTKGIAKGAMLHIAKVTQGCTSYTDFNTLTTAFNWLAGNAAAGTIVNFSLDFNTGGNCSLGQQNINASLSSAIVNAYNKGIIIVAAAGNDGCDTVNYSPTNLAEVFAVGATSNLTVNKDALIDYAVGGVSYKSRKGTNISAFAPGYYVNTINQNGVNAWGHGTSFSAGYISGVFAVACQAFQPACSTNIGTIYGGLRNTGVLNTVTESSGSVLTGATSRFIWQQW